AFAGEIKITANLTGFTDNAVVYLLSGQTPIAYQTLAQGKVELSAEVSETPENYIMYIVDNNQPYYTSLFVANETIEITANKEDFPYQLPVLNTIKSKPYLTKNNYLFILKLKLCNRKSFLYNKVVNGKSPRYKKNTLEKMELELN